MLKHTRKIKEIYEDIQRKIFYMIPEKWDKLYLYASVIDKLRNVQTGELFFYYIPKGIFKKNPVNVYEIPAKFNLDEEEYIKLVEILYNKIKELREEFKKMEQNVWSNLTISIKNLEFKVEYNYEDLENSKYDSKERHIIWRMEYLDIGMDKVSKSEKDVLIRYLAEGKKLYRKEIYTAGIYMKNIKNIVDFDTENYESIQNVEYVSTNERKTAKNQILMSEEEISKMKSN